MDGEGIVNPSTHRLAPHHQCWGLPLGLSSGRRLNLPAPPSVGTGAGRQGLTLHFFKLSVMRVSKEAVLYKPP